MLHALSTPWPCLSFDIVPDNLGDNRKQYPRTLFAVAGTQAESKRSRENELMIFLFSCSFRHGSDIPELQSYSSALLHSVTKYWNTRHYRLGFRLPLNTFVVLVFSGGTIEASLNGGRRES